MTGDDAERWAPQIAAEYERLASEKPDELMIRVRNDSGEAIAIGLLDEPNGLGLTANEAHAIGKRIAAHLVLR